MTYTVKNIKTFRGRDGLGVNCSLYKDGKRIGTVDDMANGGQYDYGLINDEWIKLMEHVRTLPPVEFHGSTLEHLNPDMFIGDLINDALEDKDLKRACKTKTIITVKDADGYFEYARKYGPESAENLHKWHGDNLKEIINERYI